MKQRSLDVKASSEVVREEAELAKLRADLAVAFFAKCAVLFDEDLRATLLQGRRRA